MAIDVLKNHPGYALRRASSAIMAGLGRRLAALKLRPTEATVLLVINANPNIKQSEIARMLDIASANMAPLISRLADHDLVDRQPVDGRSHGLNLSSQGKALTRKVKKTIEAYEAELLAKIAPGQRAAFLATLQSFWDQC